MSVNKFICGDDAVAEGVRLARPHVISAYPITPQTIVVERLSDYVEDGSLDSEYIHVESEHSAMSAAIGVSAVGARAFTATSSQGLLYMAEAMYYASGGRYPIVMMNANRALAAPWNIYGDHTDALSQLNSGWIQVYVENAQEALDMVIQSYKIAENKDVMTPMMVNLDGFILTHTYESVEVPEQSKVDAFLPAFETVNKMSLENPMNACMTAGKEWHFEFRLKQEMGMQNAFQVIGDVNDEYAQAFGRDYGGLIEAYECDDADVVLVALGSVCGTIRPVVDEMRAEGHKVGLLKIRYMRPFPKAELSEALKDIKAVGVIDKDLSFGYEGTVYTNLMSSLYDDSRKVTTNFIAGIGGRDITKDNVNEMYLKLLNALNKGEMDRLQYINVRCDNA